MVRTGLAVVAPLLAAFAQQQVLVALVDAACRQQSTLALHLVALPALLVAGAALWVTRVDWSASRRTEASDRTRGGSSAFGAGLGFASGAIAVVLIVSQWLPLVFLSPCQR